MKPYKIKEENLPVINDPVAAYGWVSSDAELFISRARTGVTFKFLTQLADKLSLSMYEISDLLHVSLRTLQRYTPSKKLDTDASSKVLQLSSLFQKGVIILGSEQNFNAWLSSPIPALNGKKPKEFLDTPFGFQLLEEELDRIKFGIFA